MLWLFLYMLYMWIPRAMWQDTRIQQGICLVGVVINDCMRLCRKA
jgi:hypothetical protein